MWGGRPYAHAVTRLSGSLFACLFQRATCYGADIHAVTLLCGSLLTCLFHFVCGGRLKDTSLWFFVRLSV